MIHSITFYFLCSSPLSLTECLTSTEEHLCCQAVIHISFSKHRPDKNNNNNKKSQQTKISTQLFTVKENVIFPTSTKISSWTLSFMPPGSLLILKQGF